MSEESVDERAAASAKRQPGLERRNDPVSGSIKNDVSDVQVVQIPPRALFENQTDKRSESLLLEKRNEPFLESRYGEAAAVRAIETGLFGVLMVEKAAAETEGYTFDFVRVEILSVSIH